MPLGGPLLGWPKNQEVGGAENRAGPLSAPVGRGSEQRISRWVRWDLCPTSVTNVSCFAQGFPSGSTGSPLFGEPLQFWATGVVGTPRITQGHQVAIPGGGSHHLLGVGLQVPLTRALYGLLCVGPRPLSPCPFTHCMIHVSFSSFWKAKGWRWIVPKHPSPGLHTSM